MLGRVASHGVSLVKISVLGQCLGTIKLLGQNLSLGNDATLSWFGLSCKRYVAISEVTTFDSEA